MMGIDGSLKRMDSGNQNRGYVANATESMEQSMIIIINFQFKQNTHSDREGCS